MGTVRYDSQAVFVGPIGATGSLASGDIKQLNRIQSTNYSIELVRENTMSLGSSFANDNIKDAPFVNLTLDYLVTNGQNEKNLGFIVDGEHGATINLGSGERDFFLLLDKPIENPLVMSIGNGMLMKYAVQGSVNDFLKASADIRGFNIKVDEGTSGNFVPRVSLQGIENTTDTYELPPVTQDIRGRTVGGIEDNIYIGSRHLNIHFPSNNALAVELSGENRSYLQSFNFSIGLDRNEISKIGVRYPIKRCLQFPMQLTLSASLLLNNYVADKMQNYLCQDDSDVVIDVKHNDCEVLNDFWQYETEKIKIKYTFRGLKLKSFSSSDSIGDRKTVNLEWSVPIGNAFDLRRNLFISGDFGSYLFPLENVRQLSGENVTGQNLRALVEEFVYKRTKPEVQSPEFNLNMTSNLDISPDYPAYSTFFEGNSGIYDLSGKFGQDIVSTNYVWNSDGYSTIVEGLPASGYSQRFSLIEPQYIVGYPALNDPATGKYNFYFKGEGFNTEPIEVSLVNLPTWITPNIQFPTFSINPDKPYYFNSFGLMVNAVDTPSGTPFNFQMVARNSKMKKIYDFQARTPYSFHVVLPAKYSKKTSVWLDPYNETKVTRGDDNYVSSMENSALRAEDYGSIVGASNNNPFYVYQGKNNRSYLNFDSGNYLQYTGQPLEQDFRNFTFFAVFLPDVASSGDCALLHLYNSTSGTTLNSAARAFFGRKALSNDLVFYYVNPTGVSGLSGVQTSSLQVTSCFDPVNWNMASIVYDGNVASGRRGGTGVGTQNFFIVNSGSFDRIEFASNGYKGKIAEAFLIPYKLPASEILEVEAYLKYKWNV